MVVQIERADARPITAGISAGLAVDGSVSNELWLAVSDLRRFPVSRVSRSFPCSKPGTGRAVRVWSGVRVRDLLEMADPLPSARKVVLNADDTWANASLRELMQSDAIVALEVDGEPLGTATGGPLRLVSRDLDSNCNVKWLDNLRVKA